MHDHNYFGTAICAHKAISYLMVYRVVRYIHAYLEAFQGYNQFSVLFTPYSFFFLSRHYSVPALKVCSNMCCSLSLNLAKCDSWGTDYHFVCKYVYSKTIIQVIRNLLMEVATHYILLSVSFCSAKLYLKLSLTIIFYSTKQESVS